MIASDEARRDRELEYHKRRVASVTGAGGGRVKWMDLPLRCRKCVSPDSFADAKPSMTCACGLGWAPAECRLSRGRVIWKGLTRFLEPAPDGPPWPMEASH